MSRGGVLVLVLTVIAKVIAQDFDLDGLPTEGIIPRYAPASASEYIRHIHSMINAYRSDTTGNRFVIETNALIDTKYRTLKRNADLINSLLSLPKGMDTAGR